MPYRLEIENENGQDHTSSPMSELHNTLSQLFRDGLSSENLKKSTEIVNRSSKASKSGIILMPPAVTLLLIENVKLLTEKLMDLYQRYNNILVGSQKDNSASIFDSLDCMINFLYSVFSSMEDDVVFTCLRLACARNYREGKMDDICSILDILVLFMRKLLDRNRQKEKDDIYCNGFTEMDKDGVDEDVGGFAVFSQVSSLSASVSKSNRDDSTSPIAIDHLRSRIFDVVCCGIVGGLYLSKRNLSLVYSPIPAVSVMSGINHRQQRCNNQDDDIFYMFLMKAESIIFLCGFSRKIIQSMYPCMRYQM